MPQFIITAPNGKKYKVTGESKDGAMAALRQQLEGAAPPIDTSAISAALPDVKIPQGPSVTADTPWTEVGQQALQNTPASAYQFGSDLVSAVSHPLQTVQAVGDLGAGALREGARYALPTSWFNAIDSVGNQDAGNRASATASAVKDFYANRYGSMEGFKQAVAQDPVGVMGDAATVLTGGEGAAVRVLGPASKTAKVLGTAARVTNPFTVPEKALAATGKVAGGVTKTLLGATTGTSGETISEAYRAGRKGGEASKTFRDNMRGNVDQADVIQEAKTALGNIADQRDRQYQVDMRGIKADKSTLDMAPVEGAFQNLVDSMYHNGHAGVSDRTVKVLKDIGSVIDEWSNDPSMHTAYGFDVLKRRIDDLMPPITEKTAQAERAVTNIRNAVKDAILRRFPQYKNAMENYEKSKRMQTEIERTLAVGKKNSADQTLRRMQSLTRNNVNTNYGARMSSAKQLEAAGAPNLMPALAGQAMNTWVPRGLLGPVMAGGGALGAYFNPAFWAALPAFSPRLVGEATRGVGALARGLDALPKPTKAQLLLAAQSGRVGLLGQ